MSADDLSDRPVDVVLSAPQEVGRGFYRYERYRVKLDGVEIERDFAAFVVRLLPCVAKIAKLNEFDCVGYCFGGVEIVPSEGGTGAGEIKNGFKS